MLVKNIRNLRVRIFGVNTENFYHHKSQNTDSNDINYINLDQEME